MDVVSEEKYCYMYGEDEFVVANFTEVGRSGTDRVENTTYHDHNRIHSERCSRDRSRIFCDVKETGIAWKGNEKKRWLKWEAVLCPCLYGGANIILWYDSVRNKNMYQIHNTY